MEVDKENKEGSPRKGRGLDQKKLSCSRLMRGKRMKKRCLRWPKGREGRKKRRGARVDLGDNF